MKVGVFGLVLSVLAVGGCGNGNGAGADALADAGPDGSAAGCPLEWATAEGTTCGAAATVCGLADCAPCAACDTLRCVAGTWRRASSGAVPGCGSGGADDHDTVAGDAIGYVCDAIGSADGYNPPCGPPAQVEPEPLVPVRCLNNSWDIVGHACATEGETCGLERCGDPCQRCWFDECRQGLWIGNEVLPSPTCFPAGLEVGPDAPCSQLGCRPAYDRCGQVPAEDYACGYCACAEGDRKCGAVDEDERGGGRSAVLVCDGGCFAPTPCEAGDACLDVAPLAVTCLGDVASCADLALYYQALLESIKLCDYGLQCDALPVACGGAGGDGEAAVNDEAYFTAHGALGKIMARAVQLGCEPVACEAKPAGDAYVDCVGGLCGWVARP